MTTNFALEYITRRMQELGVNNNYLLKFRHFVIQSNDNIILEGYNEYFLLVEADSYIIVRSEFGVYDLFDGGINEQQYEHQGKITITNTSEILKNVKFIQVIPIHI